MITLVSEPQVAGADYREQAHKGTRVEEGHEIVGAADVAGLWVDD